MKPSIWYSAYDNNDYKGQESSFYDPKQFKWAKEILAHKEVIEKELSEYLQTEEKFDPYFNQSLTSEKDKWKTIGLKFWSINNFTNQKKFPKTTEIINGIPELYSASFNKLEAGASIRSHCGDTNAIFRCHLGIHIPADLPKCGFKVGNEQQGWKKGELLVFCDAKRHEAWNLSEKDRYIFLFDIMRDEFGQQKKSVISTVLSFLFLQKVALFFVFLFRIQDPQKIERIPRKWIRPLIFILRPFARAAAWYANRRRIY